MAEIRHRIGVEAQIEDVYDAVATSKGVARWWTEDTGEDPGGAIGVTFGGARAATMELAEQTPPTHIVWRFVQGPAEWVGTTATFDLRRTGEETVLLFTHAGWAEPVEFMHHCSTRWGYFLLSLKHALEGAAANPWPHDEKASTWG
ncbi:MAG TPA: SRPBCC domain-containing protein [Acidimicrobiales bacterium]|jgi:uncharacterized protein YndB with AHSA1/START domain